MTAFKANNEYRNQDDLELDFVLDYDYRRNRNKNQCFRTMQIHFSSETPIPWNSKEVIIDEFSHGKKTM